jgi:hypothetical protein
MRQTVITRPTSSESREIVTLMESSYSGYDVRAGNNAGKPGYSRKTCSADLGSDKQGVTSIDDLKDYEGPDDLPPLDIPKHITTLKIPIFNGVCTIGKSEDMMHIAMNPPSYNVIELHRDGDSWIVD